MSVLCLSTAHLGWNAAHIEACAPQAAPALDASHFQAQLRAFDGCYVTARAATDHHNILQERNSGSHSEGMQETVG
jgi:hypothetical protein